MSSSRSLAKCYVAYFKAISAVKVYLSLVLSFYLKFSMRESISRFLAA
jgi:hypothetical protein